MRKEIFDLIKDKVSKEPVEISIECTRCKTINQLQVVGLTKTSDVLQIVVISKKDTEERNEETPDGSDNKSCLVPVSSMLIKEAKEKHQSIVIELGQLTQIAEEFLSMSEHSHVIKRMQICSLLDSGERLLETRKEVFPELDSLHWYTKQQVVGQKTETAKQLRNECRQIMTFMNSYILDAWGCEGKDFNRKRKSVRSRLRRESGFPKARALALERDGRKCVITGRTDNLEVHHINGNYKHNLLENLVTLNGMVHRAVSSKIDPYSHYTWWPGMEEKMKSRFEYGKKYVKYLRETGYPEASMIWCKGCKSYHIFHEETEYSRELKTKTKQIF